MKVQNKTIMWLLSMLLTLFSNGLLSAQNLSRDVKISFLGIDYSHVKLVGEMASWGDNSMDPQTVVDKYFPGWNGLFVNEAKKYDLNKFFKTSNMEEQSSFFDNTNATTNADNLMQVASPTVSEADVESWVKQYNYNSMSAPYGIFLVATELNKAKVIAKYYLVLVDKQNKSFYISKELGAKPGGFGFRNYWASSFYEVLKNAKSSTKAWFSKD